MIPPPQAVENAFNHLSDEAWGCILIIVLFIAIPMVIYLVRWIRQLHKDLMELSASRKEDADIHSAQAQAATEKSMEVAFEAKQAMKEVTKVAEQVRAKVELCPTRTQGGRT